MRTDYYSPSGEPITVEESEDIRRNRPDLFRVGKDEAGGCGISTVWLGLDHSWHDGPPMIYETLVQSRNLHHMERYSTREEAEAGHARWVRWARRTAWRRWIAARLIRLAEWVGGEHYEVE